MASMVIAIVFDEPDDSILLGEIIDRAKKIANDVPGVRIQLAREDAAETIKFFCENGELPVDEEEVKE